MPRKSNTEHCVMRNGHPFCTHCGQSYVMNLPAPLNVAVAIMDAFVETHLHCEKTWTEPTPDMAQDAEQRVLWWYANGERGVSSETMAAHLVSIKGELVRSLVKPRPRASWNHPLDPSDFRRCHLLLEAVPELREELHRMKEVSPVWSALVDNWDRLTEMLKEQMATDKRNGMYEFMKELGCQ